MKLFTETIKRQWWDYIYISFSNRYAEIILKLVGADQFNILYDNQEALYNKNEYKVDHFLIPS